MVVNCDRNWRPVDIIGDLCPATVREGVPTFKNDTHLGATKSRACRFLGLPSFRRFLFMFPQVGTWFRFHHVKLSDLKGGKRRRLIGCVTPCPLLTNPNPPHIRPADFLFVEGPIAQDAARLRDDRDEIISEEP